MSQQPHPRLMCLCSTVGNLLCALEDELSGSEEKAILKEEAILSVF